MALPSRQDLFARARRYVQGLNGLQISPKIIDVPGSDVNLVLGAGSVMGEACVAAFAMCMEELFVFSARGPALDRIAFDRYGLVRFGAQPATVDLVLARPTFAAGGGTVIAGTRVQTADGVQFALDNDVVFGATDLSKTATATCLNAGALGNVTAGSITRFVDQPFDTTIALLQQAAAAGGVESEDDIRFKARIRGFFATLRRGVLGAIEYGALQVDGVAVSKALETVNPYSHFPEGFVQLFIADADGNASGPMIQAVRDVLLDWRAMGIPVDVQGGTVVYQGVNWDLEYLTGFDTVRSREQVRAVTVAVNQFLRPGDTLYRSNLIAAAKSVPGVIVREGSLVAPAGDVVPAQPNFVIRTRPQDVGFAE